MSEVQAAGEEKHHETLHYYTFRNTSVKLTREGNTYAVIVKKYILYFFKRIKRYEYTGIHAAEDKYLEIKSMLQYRGRSW